MSSADAPARAAPRRRLGRRGTAAVEFATLAPLLGLLTFGTVDFVLFMRAQAKIDGAAVQLGQTVSQCETVSDPGDITDFWGLAQATLGGLGNVLPTGTGTVIISAVSSTANGHRVSWQRRSNTLHTSPVGTEGGAATIPGGYAVPAGQLLIVTEVFVPTQMPVLGTTLASIGMVPTTLRGVTFLLSRSPDPGAVGATPQSSSSKVCMQ